MRTLILLTLLPACDKAASPTDGGDADTDADADADTDADTDTDTDSDTDTDPPRHPDCPEDGQAVLAVTVLDATPAITATDELSFALFPVEGGPPVFFYTASGAGAATLPATFYANNAPPGTYEYVTNCKDIGGDTVTRCDGADDVLVEFTHALTVEAEKVHSWDVDFTASTHTTPVLTDPRADCP